MSEITYIPFSVYDYKGETTLSSFALADTPLKFIPTLDNFETIKIFWEFGDGTTSRSLTGVKSYDNPGAYSVKLTIYDCFTNALISTETKSIQIYDFFQHRFNVDFDDSGLYDSIEWKNGKINGPITITAFYPINQIPSSIFYDVNDSLSVFYYSIDNNKFAHLSANYSFFEKVYNYKLSSYQFDEIIEIKPVNTSVYAKIDGVNIVFCDETDESAFFVGLSGSKEVYFKDDSVSGLVDIDLYFDRNTPIRYLSGSTLNNMNVSFSANIIENDEVSRLSITSNGLDGEFYSISSFYIDDMKFSNTKIPFVVKIKDSENFSVKNFAISSLSSFNVDVLSANSPLSNNLFSMVQLSTYNGAAMGYLVFENDTRIDDITIFASTSVINLEGTTFSLSGISNVFEVYPQDYITLTKKNEDFDATEMFKGLRFQEFLLDKNVLFDDFIGSIFGNIDSGDDTLGKKIHEKIANFIDNNQDVDRDEIFALFSQMDMMNTQRNSFDANKFKFPESIKRLIDLCSINKNKLFGTTNKFSQNFDINGRTEKDEYGINIGNEINTDTYIISSGYNIVALENFSGDYLLLNTTQPVSSTNSHFYQLSAYSSDWGWHLVLPDTFTYDDFPKFYTFFEYISTYDGTISNNTLLNVEDFYSSNIIKNADSNDDIIPNDIIFNNKIKDTLYQTLSLIVA